MNEQVFHTRVNRLGKTTRTRQLFAVGVAALLLAGGTAQATIIYQDNFIGGPIGTDLNNSVPDVRLDNYGGSASATWSATTGDWLFNGAGVSSARDDKNTASLPFTPFASTVYILEWTWTQTAGHWWMVVLSPSGAWAWGTVGPNPDNVNGNGIEGLNTLSTVITTDAEGGYSSVATFNGTTAEPVTGLTANITAVGFVTQAGTAATVMKSMSLSVAVAGTSPSTTALVRSPGTGKTSTYGDSLSFDVTVAEDGGPGVPTGSVILKDGGSSGTTIGTGSLSGGTCTITTTTLTGGGHDNIVAVYDGDATYTGSISSALDTQTVNPATPIVTVTGSASFLYNGSAQGPNTADAGGSTGALTFSYAGTGSTTYEATAIPPTDLGTYTCTVTVAADVNYIEASSDPMDFTIDKGSQTITFTLGTNVAKTLADTLFADTATASSGLAVTYSSDDTNVATVDINTGMVTIIGVGIAHILADQAGDGNYNAAPQVSQELTVTIKAVSFTETLMDTSSGATGAEIQNDGTLVRAYRFGEAGTITVNGLTFEGAAGPGNDSALSGTWGGCGYLDWWVNSAITDTDYLHLTGCLLQAPADTAGTKPTLTINGLTVGNIYRLQLFSNSPRGGVAEVEGASSAMQTGDRKFVMLTATWTAADTTLNMRWVSQTNADPVHFSGYALHDMGSGAPQGTVIMIQ